MMRQGAAGAAVMQQEKGRAAPVMNETQYDVIAIGNAIVDVLAKADDAFLTELLSSWVAWTTK